MSTTIASAPMAAEQSTQAAIESAAHSRASLKSRAMRGLAISGMGTAGKTAIDLGAQLVLLRLLAPEHFGVFAMAQALSGFASCFSDAAGQKFLVQRPAITPRVVASVFWFELALGIAVAGAWSLLAWPVLTALGKPEQVPFAWGLAVWIVAERLLLPRVLLERELKFGALNIALFGGVVGGSAAMIAGAFAGAGPWCFVLGLVVRTVVSAALVWRAAGFVPAPTMDLATVRAQWAFGAPLLLSTALAFAYTNVDYLIVGGVAGYAAVGLYYAAYRYPHYLNQFNIVLASVVFPSFSRAADDAHLARGLRLLTRYAALLAFAPAAAMWVEGDALVRVLLGEKWAAATFAFQCFTTLAAARLAFTHWSHVLTARGHTRPLLIVSAVNLPLIAAGAWVGTIVAGIEGAAIAVTTISLATLVVCCGVFLKRTLPMFQYGEALRPALVATLAAMVAMVGLQALLPQTMLASAAVLVVGAIAYAACAWGLCGGELKRLWRERRGR